MIVDVLGGYMVITRLVYYSEVAGNERIGWKVLSVTRKNFIGLSGFDRETVIGELESAGFMRDGLTGEDISIVPTDDGDIEILLKADNRPLGKLETTKTARGSR